MKNLSQFPKTEMLVKLISLPNSLIFPGFSYFVRIHVCLVSKLTRQAANQNRIQLTETPRRLVPSGCLISYNFAFYIDLLEKFSVMLCRTKKKFNDTFIARDLS